MTIHADIDPGPARLRALQGCGLLAAKAPPHLVDACHAARARFDVPVAMVTLALGDRLHVAAAAGTTVLDGPRRGSFCDHVLRGDEVLVVPDAAADPRFADLPAVRRSGGLRFYAGAPLAHVRGLRLGALCLLDTRPRDLSAGDRAQLERMADDLMAQAIETEFDRLAGRTIG